MSGSKTTQQLSAIGLAAGIVAAVSYTGANICLRKVVHLDFVWVTAMKALPTFLLVVPMMGMRAAQAKPLWTTKGTVGWLVIAGVCAQIFGNAAFQWSLSVLGLAVSVPMLLGAMLVGGAVIGRLVLKEPVRPRTGVAVVVLIIATVVLTRGAQSGGGGSLLPDENPWWQIALAVIGNMLAGMSYAFLGTIMRRSMRSGLSLVSTMFVLSLVGMTVMFSWALYRVGVVGIVSTTSIDLWIMFAAGALNAIAFFSLAKSLQQIPVLYVQMLNATQAAMAAFAGWLIFGEVLDPWLQLGLLLTASGLILAGTGRKRKPAAVAIAMQPPLSDALPTDLEERQDRTELVTSDP